MNVLHEQVNHRQYGIGKVTSQDMTSVTVEFCEKYGEKKFLYPSAFESFLELCDPVLRGNMDSELQLIRERINAERKQREEDTDKRREDERRSLVKQKRTATKKRPATKKAPAKP